MNEITHRDKRHLSLCYPPFAAKIEKLLNECHQSGVPVHITQSFRFFGEQDVLFAQGKSQKQGGSSKHNFYLAIDFCFDNGEADGVQDPYKEPFPGAWEFVAKKANAIGLVSGFYWKSFQDKPHIEYPVNASIEEIRSVFLKQGKDGLFKYLDQLGGSNGKSV